MPIHGLGEAMFESNAMAMQAVLDGVGVAVAQLAYVTDALATGRLVAPFPIVAHKPEKWMLEYRPNREGDPALVAFRAWLHGEAQQQRHVDAEVLNRSSRPVSLKTRTQRKRSARGSR